MKNVLIVLCFLFAIKIQARNSKDTSGSVFMSIFLPRYFNNYQGGYVRQSIGSPRVSWLFSLNYYYVPTHYNTTYSGTTNNSLSLVSISRHTDYESHIMLGLGFNYDIAHLQKLHFLAGLHIYAGRYLSAFSQEKVTDTGTLFSGSSWHYDYEQHYSTGLVVALNPEILASYKLSKNVNIAIGVNIFDRFRFGRERIITFHKNTNLDWDHILSALSEEAYSNGNKTYRNVGSSPYDRLNDTDLFFRLTARL